MKTTTLYSASLLIVLWIASSLEVEGQNIYIRIIDQNTYRHLSNVQVEFQSDRGQFVLHSSPIGEVSESIPSGTYSITLSRSGYKTKHKDNITIHSSGIKNMTIRMQQDETGRPVTATTPSTFAHNKFFAELGVHFGNIEAFSGSFGYFFFPQTYVKVQYAHSRQFYTSIFFVDPEASLEVTFNNIFFGLGYEFFSPITEVSGISLAPEIMVGMETAANNNLIANALIKHMISPGLRPGLQFVLQYTRIAVTFGISYSLWLSNPINEDRHMLENGINGQPIQWADDLFPKREGLSMSGGIRLFF